MKIFLVYLRSYQILDFFFDFGLLGEFFFLFKQEMKVLFCIEKEIRGFKFRDIRFRNRNNIQKIGRTNFLN